MSFEEGLIAGAFAIIFLSVVRLLLSALIPHWQALFIDRMAKTAKEIKQVMSDFSAVWNVSMILRQLVLEFRVEKFNDCRLIQRLLHDSLVLVRVKGRFALRP